MTVDDLTSTRGAVQDATNASAMMTTGMMVTNVMAAVMMVWMMMLMLTMNSSSTIAASSRTGPGIGSPLAAAVGVIE